MKTKALSVFSVILCFFILTVLSNFLCIKCVNADSIEYKVILEKSAIVEVPNSSLKEENIVCYLDYNNIVILESEEEVLDQNAGSNLKYYKVVYNNKQGYILTGSVTSVSNKNLETKLQTNGKTNTESYVYIFVNNKYEKLKIAGSEVVIKENTDIKLLEEYNSKNEYTKVSFKQNDDIISGYILTSNINVGGFNYVLVIVIFVLVIVFSTVIPIIIKNVKKKKNQPIDKISTSPHKTSK